VFDGLVDLYPNPIPNPELHVGGQSKRNRSIARPEQLSTGDGVLLRADGKRLEIEARTNDFVSFTQVARLVDESIGQRQETWLQWKRSFTKDPRIYGWFDFDQESISLRRMQGLVPTDAPMTGALVGCRVAAGRWPGNTSLEFKHPGDRVRLSLPEELESVTLMAWLRIDGLDRRFNGLLMSDTGRPHWQINGRGEIVFGVRDSQTLHNYKSDAVVDEFMFGRWIHLTTVYDSPGKVVKHYLNGTLLNSEDIAQPVALLFGDTEIGNWRNRLGKTRTPIRTLNGRIDELIIFRAALPDDEIETIHEFGRP
jgi:hypothetical protein